MTTRTYQSEPQTGALARMDPAAGRASWVGAVDRAEFIEAMSTAVTGVYIVTTDGVAGRIGITASAVNSVSADPPLVLACINRRSPARAGVQSNGVFCVNTLSTKQRFLADVFSGRQEHGAPYDFSNGVWEPGATNAPHLVGAVSTFECELAHAYEVGSHTVFIGEVVATTRNGGTPLLYTSRTFGEPCRWTVNR